MHMALDIFDNNDNNRQLAVKSGLKMASLRNWKKEIVGNMQQQN